jgi:hypothetical protein
MKRVLDWAAILIFLVSVCVAIYTLSMRHP